MTSQLPIPAPRRANVTRRGQFQRDPVAAEQRALELFDHIPDRCIAVPVPDAGQRPHLWAGEIAIVDTESVAPLDGEMFVIRWCNGRISLGQVRRDKGSYYDARRNAFVMADEDDDRCRSSPGWYFGNYRAVQPRDGAEAEAALFAGELGLSEGPMTTAHMTSQLLGQVIGVACFALFTGKGGAS